jgi:hypothetical protein
MNRNPSSVNNKRQRYNAITARVSEGRVILTCCGQLPFFGRQCAASVPWGCLFFVQTGCAECVTYPRPGLPGNGIGGSGGIDSIEESKRLTISDNAKASDVGSPGGGKSSESANVRQSRGFVSALCRRLSAIVSADSTFKGGNVLSWLLNWQHLMGVNFC